MTRGGSGQGRHSGSPGRALFAASVAVLLACASVPCSALGEKEARRVELLCTLNDAEIPPPDRVVLRVGDRAYAAPVVGKVFVVPPQAETTDVVVELELAGRSLWFRVGDIRDTGPRWDFRIYTAPFPRDISFLAKRCGPAAEIWEFGPDADKGRTMQVAYASPDGKDITATCREVD